MSLGTIRVADKRLRCIDASAEHILAWLSVWSCGIRSPILLPMDKSGIFLSDFRRVSFDHVTYRLFEGKFVRRVRDPFARHGSDALNNASWFFREFGPRILKAAQDGG